MNDETSAIAVEVQDLGHHYGERPALAGLSFRVDSGEIFGLLGPNGSGKTTLFRILSTLFPPSRGAALIFGRDVQRQAAAVRALIGVVFQSPSLDRKLTVAENLVHQGHLYGLRGRGLRQRIDALLERVGLAERAKDRVETLSGGLKRRAEVAKGLLHGPRLLILDEPSTGLDPGARLDLWIYLRGLSKQDGITVLVTTHLMEEAERCDRLLILNEGRTVALGTPEQLRRDIGGAVLRFQTRAARELADWLAATYELEATVFEDTVRIETEDGYALAQKVIEGFKNKGASPIEMVTVGQPTLEDVFIHRTGHRFWDAQGTGDELS